MEMDKVILFKDFLKKISKVFNLKGGIVVSKDNINEIEKYIDKFKRDSVNINKSNKNKIEEDFKKYKLEVKKMISIYIREIMKTM